MGSKPARIAAIRLEVVARSVPSEMRERFQSVIDHCTVHNSLIQAPEVSVALDIAPPVALVKQ